MITVEKIVELSSAESAGILAGDKIMTINGEEIRDRLDFEFYRTESELEISLLRNNQELNFVIEREYGEELGIEPEVMKIEICKNNCVFCFVYQNPKGMRKSLYIKDEDYRYSFLDGHFTTLSNMDKKKWDRILEQRLSPIYISVQCTDEVIRAKLLGNNKLEPILPRLRWLVENKIDFHTQLVVVPGYNDGAKLEESINDLLPFYPALQSISVVPIGLTAHRAKLTDLRKLTKEESQESLDIVNRAIQKSKTLYGENLVFASDEMYIQAEAEFPPPSFYGNYSQYENGVGTITALLEDFEKELPKLPKFSPTKHKTITVLTGGSASKYQHQILERLKKEKGLQYELIVCQNFTFGESVTVTGLLCGGDFIKALKNSKETGPVLIPPNSLNKDDVFMDDLRPSDITLQTGREVRVPKTFKDYFNVM